MSQHILAPNAFYLDDRQDFVSRHLLLELGVLLSTLGDVSPIAEPPYEEGSSSGMRKLLPVITDIETCASDLQSSSTLVPGEAITYKPIGGACFLDVRDSADAWIRIIIGSGEVAVIFNTSTKRRVLIPQVSQLSSTSSTNELTYALAGRLPPPFISSLDAQVPLSSVTSSSLSTIFDSVAVENHHCASRINLCNVSGASGVQIECISLAGTSLPTTTL